MRTVVISLLAGILIGATLMWAGVTLTGGWYVYFTVPSYECQDLRTSAEPVPYQSNPCAFRRPRWQLFR